MSTRTMERRAARTREALPMTLPQEPAEAPAAPDADAHAAPDLKAAARPDGTGFRAIITEDGRTVWACAHVHFTEHSAKTHAEQQLQAMR
jgi:hypothetical protein